MNSLKEEGKMTQERKEGQEMSKPKLNVQLGTLVIFVRIALGVVRKMYRQNSLCREFPIQLLMEVAKRKHHKQLGMNRARLMGEILGVHPVVIRGIDRARYFMWRANSWQKTFLPLLVLVSNRGLWALDERGLDKEKISRLQALESLFSNLDLADQENQVLGAETLAEAKSLILALLAERATPASKLRAMRLQSKALAGTAWANLKIQMTPVPEELYPYIQGWTQTDWIWWNKIANFRLVGLPIQAEAIRRPSVLYKAVGLLSDTRLQILRIHPEDHWVDVLFAGLELDLPKEVKQMLTSKSPKKLARGLYLVNRFREHRTEVTMGGPRRCWVPEKTAYQGEDYYLEVIQTPQGLVDEGDEMAHCVGQYVDDCTRGQCSIWRACFNVGGRTYRSTVEVRDGYVRQNMQWRDRPAPTPEWMEHWAAGLIINPPKLEAPTASDEELDKAFWDRILGLAGHESYQAFLKRAERARCESRKNGKIFRNIRANKKSKEKAEDRKRASFRACYVPNQSIYNAMARIYVESSSEFQRRDCRQDQEARAKFELWVLFEINKTLTSLGYLPFVKAPGYEDYNESVTQAVNNPPIPQDENEDDIPF
jgi:hypothetical protein